MCNLPNEILLVLRHFEPAFSERVWQEVLVRLVGAILAPGSRTVAAILRVMGLHRERQFVSYHRVLSRARWSGLTVSRGKPTGIGMILTAAAGYTATPLLGLGGAWLLAAHHITLLLWLATALLLALLVMVRNAYGVLTVTVTGAAFLLVSWLTGPDVQAVFAYTAVWFMLLGGVRPVFELQSKRRHGGAPDSDADQLARLTHVPPAIWLFFFHAVSLCSLIGGGRWLLGL